MPLLILNLRLLLPDSLIRKHNNSLHFIIYKDLIAKLHSQLLSRAPASGPRREGKGRRVSITTIQS